MEFRRKERELVSLEVVCELGCCAMCRVDVDVDLVL